MPLESDRFICYLRSNPNLYNPPPPSSSHASPHDLPLMITMTVNRRLNDLKGSLVVYKRLTFTVHTLRHNARLILTLVAQSGVTVRRHYLI